MITGSSNLLIALLLAASYSRYGCKSRRAGRRSVSYGHHSVTFCGLLDLFVTGHPPSFDDRRASLAGVDDVVDDRVACGDVWVDLLADRVQHRLAGRLGVLGGLDRGAADDFDRALGTHHRDLGSRPGDDQVGLVGLA